MAAPHATGALALVMERYPYMNNQQALEVLTTATQLDGSVTDAPTERVGWGVANLNRAMRGPGQLLGAFDANLGAGQRDVWSNDISDKALIQRQREDLAEHTWQQTLQDKGWQNGVPAGASQQDQTDYAIGMARDAAAATRLSGQPDQVRRRALMLTGDNTYRGPTTVNGGLLTSTVADLGGDRQRQRHPRRFRAHRALTANSGGRVAPGNSIGTLNVAGDVTFAPGSTYAVGCRRPAATASLPAAARPSAAPRSACRWKTARPCSAPPSAKPARAPVRHSASGRRHSGPVRRGAAGLPVYRRQPRLRGNGIQLDIQRNATSFASVGQTPNQRAVATAVEGLGAGNSVYESCCCGSAPVAQQAFQQLSGEIYPALGSMLINDSRQLRDAVGERLHDANATQATAGSRPSAPGAPPTRATTPVTAPRSAACWPVSTARSTSRPASVWSPVTATAR
jgi:subtilase-type serine protease